MADILAVDDDSEILKVIKKALEKEGHLVTCCSDIAELNKEKLTVYDLLLLDVMMPKVDGFTFCREIRQMVDCPIIFITGKTMDRDLEMGFASGGDDYLKKPFSIVELRARVAAHLRRQVREYHAKIISGSLYFDLSGKTLFMDGEPVKLTKSEYEICEFLVQNKGQVFSLEQIVEKVFGYDSESDSSVIREHIKNIRAKLKKCGESPIETVWGIGYKWK
ncbi:MAG: response regulator transcription factor [Eubacteriales bacterium]|nr:response regulator transcription factor [Eubacteriales bacterium]